MKRAIRKKVSKKTEKTDYSFAKKIIFLGILLIISLLVISFIYKAESDRINASESKEQSEKHDNNDDDHRKKESSCPINYKHNIWKVCHYGKSYYDKNACRKLIQAFKQAIPPSADDDFSWFSWARRGPRSLECGIACAIAPSYCSGNPGVSTTPAATPTDAPVTGTVTPTTPQNPATGPYLLFNPVAQNLKTGDEFDASVMVDTLDSETLGTDAYVVYDVTMLQPVNTVQGDFYPTIKISNLTSSVAFRGIVTEPTDFRKGAGSLGTVRFKTLKKGTTTLQYYCNPVAGDTSKIVQNDFDASNIINCGDNRTLDINIDVSVTPGATTASPITSIKPTKTTITLPPLPSGKISKALIMVLILIFVILMIILGL